MNELLYMELDSQVIEGRDWDRLSGHKCLARLFLKLTNLSLTVGGSQPNPESLRKHGYHLLEELICPRFRSPNLASNNLPHLCNVICAPTSLTATHAVGGRRRAVLLNLFLKLWEAHRRRSFFPLAL
jgi:hypothetical protein